MPLSRLRAHRENHQPPLSGQHANADLLLTRGNPSASALEAPSALPSVETFFPQRAYNPSSPLCFVHIAKAAGTTVRLVMENAFAGDRTFPNGSGAFAGGYVHLKNALRAGDDLRHFDVLSGHFGAQIGNHLEPQANLFTWLREPRDQAISEFFFFVAQERQSYLRPYAERLDRGDRPETVFLDWLADQPPGCHRFQGHLVFGCTKNHSDWRKEHPQTTLADAAIDAVRRCFFIGLVEDQERSLDAFCALTSILPPRLTAKRNAGTNRPKSLNFSADEQAELERLLAPDRAFYALAKAIHSRQMTGLARSRGVVPALALVGDREALRELILRDAAPRTPVLTRWEAWDPILGENLDSREQLRASDGSVSRWRWTASMPDTFLYFRLPKGTGFELRIRLNPATPASHAQRVVLRPQMLDERTLVPYAGTRHLGLAIESISAVPFGPLGELWRRMDGDRLMASFQRNLRRVLRPIVQPFRQ